MDGLPDTLLLFLFKHLDSSDLVSLSAVCRKFWRITKDEVLWKRRFLLDFKLQPDTVISSFSQPPTWYSEYRRIIDETPCVFSEKLTHHSDEVLHVAFPLHGLIFSTCSKDGTVKLWSSDYPCQLLHDENLRQRFKWNFTQFSQFNSDDSLLLVSGALQGDYVTMGEICVFEVNRDKLTFRCRVMNKPYDVFGCWLTNDVVLNGALNLLSMPHFISLSEIWACRASRKYEYGPTTPEIVKLFKFINFHASTVRTLLVTDLVSEWVQDALSVSANVKSMSLDGHYSNVNAEVDKFRDDAFTPKTSPVVAGEQVEDQCTSLHCVPKLEPGEQVAHKTSSSFTPKLEPFEQVADQCTSLSCIPKLEPGQQMADQCTYLSCIPKLEPGEQVADQCTSSSCVPKPSKNDDGVFLLIFTTGTETYTPHQVGFKLINYDVKNMLDEIEPQLKKSKGNSDSLQEPCGSSSAANAGDNKIAIPTENVLWNENFDMSFLHANFQFPDYLIDMKGHIVGINLSKDKRFLFVNVRPWKEGSVIIDPLRALPISQHIELRVIDMENLSVVNEKVYRGHKGFTKEEECFFIFMDSCETCIASGSEDKHAFVWDRYYNLPIAHLHHDGVVNSVAFNPESHEMLVSVSDDHSIKVWRSKRATREIKYEKKFLEEP